MVFLGSWISGYLIVATNAWMQHPVAFALLNGAVHVNDYWGLLLNPWAFWQYTHTMIAAIVTASFVVAAVGAYYVLARRDVEYGKIFIRLGIIAGVAASILVAFPTGDAQVKNVYQYQPVTFAGMEGVFETKEGMELIILGQPDMEKMRIDNPLHVPKLLSFLTHFSWEAEIKGLPAFPKDEWPTNIPLLYFSYHIMVGLGTIFIAIMVLAAVLLWKERIFSAPWALWILMLSFPFPYIANTAGWMTAELGRQPWLVHNLLRTSVGASPTVSAGNGLFTLLGFLGMYFVIGVLFLLLIIRKINEGPEALAKSHKS
jgi:cytochrome d ubiquinol oxidase subunit I